MVDEPSIHNPEASSTRCRSTLLDLRSEWNMRHKAVALPADGESSRMTKAGLSSASTRRKVKILTPRLQRKTLEGRKKDVTIVADFRWVELAIDLVGKGSWLAAVAAKAHSVSRS